MKSKIIDLRSDTITRPSKPMLEAMFAAEVGDDVFGDDPTVQALERKAASMFGKEAALFCTSGTMSNQLAIRSQCTPGSEIICDSLSHVFLYEGGGVAVNAFSSVKTLNGDRGRITADMVEGAINNPDDIHQPVSRLVCIENTMNKGGGSIYNFDEIVKIKEICWRKGLKLHLDGARLFNALIETNENPENYGEVFDSISICLSKGLGCPVGSLLLGSKELVKTARRYRKLMGGGWRQAGYLAAAGIYALDNNIQRLKEDHIRAKSVGRIISNMNFVRNVYPIETNIVIFELNENLISTDFVKLMEENNILCAPFGKSLVRFVTHLDFTDEHLNLFEDRFKDINI